MGTRSLGQAWPRLGLDPRPLAAVRLDEPRFGSHRPIIIVKTRISVAIVLAGASQELQQRDKPQPTKTVWAIGSMEWLAEQKEAG
jgi:hypothetical protein